MYSGSIKADRLVIWIRSLSRIDLNSPILSARFCAVHLTDKGQPLSTAPSASAQSAATRAFLSHRDSNASLSSAAAAAALRSHTPTPTPVENVQTKRMLQRQLSNSSRGSAPGGPRGGHQPALHRTPSSGSMSSRTFREPSPRRPQTSSGETHHPPIPPLPEGLPDRRRSISLQPTRGTSQSTSRPSGRGGSVDRRSTAAVAEPTSPRGPRSGSSLELDRPGSRTSINFSYPTHARPTSPRQSSELLESPRSPNGDQSSSRPLSPQETANIQYAVSNAGSLKVKKKPRVHAPGSSEGSHLVRKATSGRPTGTAVEESPSPRAPTGEDLEVSHFEPDVAPDPAVPNGASHPAATEESESPDLPDEGDAHDEQLDHPESETAATANIRPRPKKRPSTVIEENEAEELAEVANKVEDDSRHKEPDENASVAPAVRTSPVKPIRQSLVVQPLQGADNTMDSPVRQSPSSSSVPPSLSSDRLTSDRVSEQRPARQSSISPSRSTRFSNQVTVTGLGTVIHEPPPRSMSPAKPALKNSSSPDRRVKMQAPSEISDGTSVASDDGSRSGSRKKTVKVSFDDEAEVVGVAASPPTSPEPMSVSTSPVEQNKPRTNWFSLGKKKSGTKDVATDDDFGSVLKPRPALPSFGSIRGRREPEEPSTETISDNESTVSSIDNEHHIDLAASSDHAIGGILADAHKDSAAHPGTQPSPRNEPLAPEVTSVEGTGGASDTDESRSVNSEAELQPLPTVQEEPSFIPPPSSTFSSPPVSVPEIAPPESTKESATDGALDAIPVIAVQPATPADENRNSLDLHNMPGGFPSYPSDRALTKSVSKDVEEIRSSNVVGVTSEDAGASDDDSGESVYSDAAEDPTEMDGDGFGSINAIVDSPIPVTSEFPTQAPESPIRPSAQKTAPPLGVEPPEPSQSRKKRNKVPLSSASAGRAQREKKQESTRASREADNQQATSGSPNSTWPLTPRSPPPTSAAVPVRTQAEPRPMSADPSQGSHLRQALGSANDARPNNVNRMSMPVSQTSAMPKSAPSSTRPPNRGSTYKGQPATARHPSQSAVMPGGLRRTKSNDSDSSSSFKRSRRSSRPESQFTMRRTMRSARVGSMSTADTLVDRSTSPRATMRATMRKSPPPERSLALTNSKDKTRSRPKSSATPLSYKSRFGDSDDETGGGPRRFTSRFADSSDEDEPLPTNLTPVRGIPRRRGAYDGDSTDLDDSSDEETRRNARPGRAGPNVTSTPQMTPGELEAFLSTPKKRGLLARLKSSTKSQSKDGKVRKSDLESAARRDTRLERSRFELDHMKGDGRVNGNAPPAGISDLRPTSPKLQKRKTGDQPQNGLTWPLPPGEPESSLSRDVAERPSTADGNGGWSSRLRPSLHNRQDTVSSVASGTASEVVEGRTGRKKRFPMLRKAFGLRD